MALHLVQRGGTGDGARFLGRLRAESGHCAIHAYVLMGTHAHLLVTPSRRDAATAMMLALGALAGALDATPVLAPRYFLACMRYIEWNPVRAGIVARPQDYRWSSYGANALGRPDDLVAPHPWYCALGRTPQARRAAYRATPGAPSAGAGAAPAPRACARRTAG